MTFLGPNDILVLEKNKGTVERIVDRKMMRQPLLQVENIGRQVDWGMLGIAIDENSSRDGSGGSAPSHVFLYYTKNQTSTGPTRNYVYKYELSQDKSKLVNSQLLLDLPTTSSNPDGENNHNGGKVVVGPDHNVYVIICDVGTHSGQAQNSRDGPELDGTSGILRVTQDGQILPEPLGEDNDPD
jgi:aldose sugar dehydrogenase